MPVGPLLKYMHGFRDIGCVRGSFSSLPIVEAMACSLDGNEGIISRMKAHAVAGAYKVWTCRRASNTTINILAILQCWQRFGYLTMMVQSLGI